MKLSLISTVSVLILFGFSTQAYAQSQLIQNLQTSVSADILGSATFADQDDAKVKAYNGLKIRTAEFMFYGPIDQNFDGLVNFAAHSEGDIVFAVPEVHEAYIQTSKMIPRSRVKMGQYFLAIGRLNKFHQHDWPFITAPLTQLNIFGTREGVVDTGLEYAYLLPTENYWELTLGVTNGRTFGHSHKDGPLPLWPTTYGRIATYSEFLGFGAETGLTGLYRETHDKLKNTLVGIDFTAKMRQGRILRSLIQAELWWRQVKPELGETSQEMAAYVYAEYGLSLNWSTGLRLDYGTVITSQDNHEIAVEYDIRWQASEFSRFTLSYYHYLSQSKFADPGLSSQILLQTIYMLGAHPAHDF